ncbi:hypothetical protein QO001_005665 [Methylobacterium brachiatum]|jgi:hypothetical protein|uniref:Uncharacterized protein n=1 Tax=Methylobacterium brachiatum TaxID=269660 RepID=A0AAJ1TZR7_9HYPH|nr:P1 family peptidase [Methylobacterium brachiatum]MCB4805620.1 P1 family peptidase [Methylobacterium brachiatum]MDQ0546713.1 hypothetical protein [Methylobacterium brachiatum]
MAQLEHDLLRTRLLTSPHVQLLRSWLILSISPVQSPPVRSADLDPLFEAVADGIDQAIIHALWRAETVTGRAGHRRHALTNLLPSWIDNLGD